MKKNLLTNIKAGERFGKALDISLDVMRKTPHTRLKKSAFELHYGRKPNTEISNLLNLDEIEKLTKRSVSAKPDTLQVYSFSGAGGVSDQLPMKTKKSSKDSGSPVTLTPKSLFNGITQLKPLKTEYRDVNDNKIRFEGKTTATVERNGQRNILEILITTKKTNPLLGLDWMKKLGITLDTGRTGPQINHVTEDPDITSLKSLKKLP